VRRIVGSTLDGHIIQYDGTESSKRTVLAASDVEVIS